MRLRDLVEPEWHKYVALMMLKFGVRSVEITSEELINAIGELSGKRVYLREDKIKKCLVVGIEDDID